MISDRVLQNLGFTASSLPTYDVPIDLLVPQEDNANEMTDAEFNRLTKEIAENGFLEPLTIAPMKGGKFVIVAGAQRWLAARTLGLKAIPCSLVDIPEDLRLLVNVRMNVIKGKLNPSKFTKVYEKAAAIYGTEQLKGLFGFTSTDQWNRLIDGAMGAVDATGASSEDKKNLRKKMKGVKSVDSIGKILRKFFEKSGDDLANGFVIFSHGGQSNIYIEMNEEVQGAMDAIVAKCREENINMNSVIGKALIEAGR